MGPEVSPFRLALARGQLLNRGFIGMQHRESEEFFLQGIDQGLKIWPTHWASVD